MALVRGFPCQSAFVLYYELTICLYYWTKTINQYSNGKSHQYKVNWPFFFYICSIPSRVINNVLSSRGRSVPATLLPPRLHFYSADEYSRLFAQALPLFTEGTENYVLLLEKPGTFLNALLNTRRILAEMKRNTHALFTTKAPASNAVNRRRLSDEWIGPLDDVTTSGTTAILQC